MTSELIARLERATAADQHVLIYDVLKFALEQNWIDQDTFNWAMQCRGIGAFLDAALTLVPEGAEYDITNLYGVAHVEVGLNFNDQESGVGRRKDGNVVLALLRAALKARGTAG